MTLRAVVVGTGFGCVTHVRALRAAGFDIVALVGRDPQRTAERAQLFDDERALTSLSDALALPGVDAVTIATPPHTHAELALEAIAAGHHVLCEKPLARDVGEARAMLAVAEDAGIVHLDDMNAALELLATGASCGKLAFIRRHEGQPTAAVSTVDTSILRLSCRCPSRPAPSLTRSSSRERIGSIHRARRPHQSHARIRSTVRIAAWALDRRVTAAPVR